MPMSQYVITSDLEAIAKQKDQSRAYFMGQVNAANAALRSALEFGDEDSIAKARTAVAKARYALKLSGYSTGIIR